MSATTARTSLREIQQAVATALSQRGLDGRLKVSDEAISFSGEIRGSAPLRNLVQRWPKLSPSERAERIVLLASQLAPGVRRPRLTGKTWAGIGSLLTLSGAIAGLIIHGIINAGPANAASTENDPAISREERSQRVCEAAESRVMRGGTLTAVDSEGWVVEVSVLGSSASGSSPLSNDTSLLDQGPDGVGLRLTWPGLPDSVLQEAKPVQVEKSAQGSLHMTVLTLSGEAVRSFFRRDEHINWIRFAAEFTRQRGASHAALYARCAHRRAHHVGSWFQGPDLGGAATSLLYFIGAFQETPQLKPSLLELKADGRLVTGLDMITKGMDKTMLQAVLSANGGMLTAPAQGPVMIQFPYKDSNRAARASHRLARELQINVSR